MQSIIKFATIFITAFSTLSSLAQIEQVEPPNWWVGMQHTQLQLLIHGKAIGETKPVLQYPGVKILKATKGDSKNYLFVDLIIEKNTRPGNINLQFIQNGKIVYQHAYPLLQRQKGSANLKGFNSSDVIYLITPDRFANGTETNDVVPGMREQKINRANVGARHGGDIQGMINHLDYIKEMGFTAIWPQPMLENDMAAYSYHGYSITNHYRVDPRYGDLAIYKTLSQQARERGIKLIFDGVVNHIGVNYWWMQDLPFKDWINHADTPVITNHKRTTIEDIYASQYDKALQTNGWFDNTMPDMNGKNPFMANYLIQNSIWWIETLQLGGLRQDTYCYSDKTFLKNWSCRIMQEYPDFNMVGEEWSINPLITSYWQRNKKNHDGYSGCLKTVMDFPLQAALVKALTYKEVSKWDDGMTKLYEGLANDFIYPNPNDILVMGDNHDMDRLFTQLNRDVDLTQMALGYLLTIRGIPQIYYGTEILMENSEHPNDHGWIRSDFPGGWKTDSVNAFTGKGLTIDQKNTQSYLKQLLQWRKNNDVIATGST
ncbi:MAG: hypothetical protein RLY16_2197, partial [Bacteroidota bacterium]